MRGMRRAVRDQDVFWWVDSFLRAAITKDLRDFPQLQDDGSIEEMESSLSF